MPFYLRTPEGLSDIATMTEAIRERLECYQNLYDENVNVLKKYKRALSQGTERDAVGHNLLRIKTHDNARLREIFLRNEVRLMELRLEDYRNVSELRWFFRRLNQEAQGLLESQQKANRRTVSKKKEEMCLTCVYVALTFLKEGALDHAFEEHTDDIPCENCEKFCLQIDWRTCIDLLTSRRCPLNKGKLHVYVFQWKCLIRALYKTYLLYSLDEVKANENCKTLLSEPRINDIFMSLNEPLSKACPGLGCATSGSLSLCEVDTDIEDYPPCMRRLHSVLQRDNRLSHQGRYHFSLFLKSIGLSMEDQLSYWEGKYSQDPGETSKCTHTWQKHKKRYEYSIRHMYGLEGNRIEKFGKSCLSIQGIKLSVNEEGGCPFVHDDDDRLKDLLEDCLQVKDTNSAIINEIIDQKKILPEKGCQAYFKQKWKYDLNLPNDQIKYSDPAGFYVLMGKSVDAHDELTSSSSSSSETDILD